MFFSAQIKDALVELLSDILLIRQQPETERHLIAHLRTRSMSQNIEEPIRRKVINMRDMIRARMDRYPGMMAELTQTAWRTCCLANNDSKHWTPMSRLCGEELVTNCASTCKKSCKCRCKTSHCCSALTVMSSRATGRQRKNKLADLRSTVSICAAFNWVKSSWASRHLVRVSTKRPDKAGINYILEQREIWEVMIRVFHPQKQRYTFFMIYPPIFVNRLLTQYPSPLTHPSMHQQSTRGDIVEYHSSRLSSTNQ